MNAYGPLASGYDALTTDVPYQDLADWYEAAFAAAAIPVHTVLDLGCGTGTLSLLLAGRGYEMICADPSADMLSVLQQKLFELPEGVVRPLLLCQRAEELDLYGTVDACVCSLDCVNYLPGDVLDEVLHRLHLFIAPGGVLAFDFLAPEHMRSLDGQCFVDERDGLLCLWRAECTESALHYGVDIFRQGRGGLWQRQQEEHTEYIHEPQALTALLESAGFVVPTLSLRGPQWDKGRLFLSARRDG